MQKLSLQDTEYNNLKIIFQSEWFRFVHETFSWFEELYENLQPEGLMILFLKETFGYSLLFVEPLILWLYFENFFSTLFGVYVFFNPNMGGE